MTSSRKSDTDISKTNRSIRLQFDEWCNNSVADTTVRACSAYDFARANKHVLEGVSYDSEQKIRQRYLENGPFDKIAI